MASEMTIEEAIRHAEEVAQCKCDDCGNQHRQLANWLKELVSLRAKLKIAENALDTLVTELDEVVQYDGAGDPVITCVCFELDEARMEAKTALAEILDKGRAIRVTPDI